MDFDDLLGKAKEFAEDHKDELGETASDVKDIATGDGDVTDKLKAAAEAAKENLT
jgi:hypothetical protein